MHDVDDLCTHLTRITRLDATEARKAVLELLDLLSMETADAYVVRRHRELQASGRQTNDAIFRLIADELACRPFAAPQYSERQIRRLIYG
jgi:hypothetical protein